MTLRSELAASRSIIVDCVRFAAVWVGYIDHDFTESERRLILARLPDREGGMPLARIIRYVEQEVGAGSPDELAAVFSYIKQSLAPESRKSLLRLVTEIVASDGRVSVGERHALAYLADLVGLADSLGSIFREETGLEWTEPADLSDGELWRKLEEQQNGSSAGASDQQRGRSDRGREEDMSQGAKTAERVEALAVLGLVGEPSLDEIRNAYRRLAKIHHPDRYHGLDAEAVSHATRTFQRIQKAYQILTA